MVLCESCGGETKSLGNNTYRCVYCGHTFKNEPKSVSTSSYTQRSNEGVGVFENNVNGVLEITWTLGNIGSSGSGYLIDRRGLCITNAHVVTHENKVVNNLNVKIAGCNVKATVVSLGDDKGGHGNGVDLALIRLSSVPPTAKVLSFEDFKNVKIGEQVYVIGNSLGDGTCITSGIVSDKSRVLNGKTLLMTDCAINGGNSGGPIFNAKGLVIGTIVSSRINRDGSATEGMNYAIPCNIVKDFINGKSSGGAGSKNYFMNSRARKEAKFPCPRCKSWGGDIENGIFYCPYCDYEG